MRAISTEMAVLGAVEAGDAATLVLPTMSRRPAIRLVFRRELGPKQPTSVWMTQPAPGFAERLVLLLLVVAALIGIGSCFLASGPQAASAGKVASQVRLLTSAATSNQSQ